ncbi:MAG: iron ABC transporter permease [Pseudomonadota bacterium]
MLNKVRDNPFRHSRALVPGLALLMAVLFAASLLSGRLDIGISELGELMSALISGHPVKADLASKQMVFWWIRVPRCVMAVSVGMGLSVSGAVYQAMFRNPLVSPDILGVAAGATFGAALGLVLPSVSFSQVHILAFCFGIAAVGLSLTIARIIAVRPVIVLVLSGMVVMSFFNALLMILKYLSDPYEELPSIVFWTMGGLSRTTWQDAGLTTLVTGVGVFLIMMLRFRLNVLSLGDVQARALGMNPAAYRGVLITGTSLMVAMTVATCGQISWIGLIVPHMARTLAGPDHQRMLPVTALLGGIFLIGADMMARSLTTSEIPVGIITALTGAPCFAYLLFKNRGSGWL